MSTAPQTRIYVVQRIKDANETLVRASRAGTAKRHVSGTDYTVRVASQRDLERLLRDGAPIHEAGDDDKDDAPTPAPAATAPVPQADGIY